MGVVKKVVKGIGGMFGIGGGNNQVNSSVNTAPIATAVTNSDISMQEDLVSNAKKKKKGYDAQNLANDTLIGTASSSASGSDRETL